MKRAAKILGVLVLVLVTVFVVVGLLLPSSYTVERSALIPDTTPSRVHPFIQDLNNWRAWEPWLKDDPTFAVTVGDKSEGVGASQSWTDKDGSGTLTIREVTESSVTYHLDFDSGGDAEGVLHYVSEGGGVRVTWKATGDVGFNLIARYFVANMDSYLGPMFEHGLGRLTTAVQRAPAPTPTPAEAQPEPAPAPTPPVQAVSDIAPAAPSAE